MANSKKRKITPFSLAHKAIATSTASTRFGISDEDWPGGRPEDEDIKEATGTDFVGNIEEAMDQQEMDKREAFTDEEQLLHAKLIAQLSPEEANEAIRLFRIIRRERRLGNMDAAADLAEKVKQGTLEFRNPEAEEYSPYVVQDQEANRVRSKLSEAFNWQAGAPDLVRGPTHLVGGMPGPDELVTRVTAPLEDQITRSYVEREAGEQEYLSDKDFEELFSPSKVKLSPAEKRRVQLMLEKRRKLRLLETRATARLEGRAETEGKRIQRQRRASREKDIAVPEVEGEEGKRRAIATPGQEPLPLRPLKKGEKPEEVERTREITREAIVGPLPPGELKELRNKARAERMKLERQLKDITLHKAVRVERDYKGRAIGEKPVTREETATAIDRSIQTAFETIPDPLTPPRAARGTGAPGRGSTISEGSEKLRSEYRKQLGIDAPEARTFEPAFKKQVRTTITPETTRLPRRQRERVGFDKKGNPIYEEHVERPTPIVDKALINEFKHEAIQSYHGATEEIRTAAKERAANLSNRIAQQIQDEVERRREQADLQAAINKVGPQRGYLPATRKLGEPGPVRPEDIAGIRPVEDLRFIKQLAEERRTPSAKRVAYTGEFGEAVARAHGYRIPQPEDPRAFIDPRHNPLTVEDLYEAYGHEQTKVADRLAFEGQKAKAHIEKRPILTEDDAAELRRQLRDDETLSPEKQTEIAYTLDKAFIDKPPHPIKALKKQGEFITTQTKSRIKGFIDGTTMIGVDEKGRTTNLPGRGARTVIGTNPKVRIGTSPNIAYKYQIRNPKTNSDEAIKLRSSLDARTAEKQDLERLISDIKSTRPRGTLKESIKTERDRQNLLERKQKDFEQVNKTVALLQTQLKKFETPREETYLPTDLSRTFEEGSRNRYGELTEDETGNLERDELVAPVEEIHGYQQETIRFRPGTRVPKTGAESTPKGIDEIRYVAVPGAKDGVNQIVSDPTGSRVMVPQIRAYGGRWVEVDREEYNAALKERRKWEAAKQATKFSQWSVPPPEADERPRDRKIQYRYMKPEDLELTPNSRDVATVRVPKIGPIGERVIPLQFSENEASRWDQFPGKLARVRGERLRLEAAKQWSAIPNNHPEQEEKYDMFGIPAHDLRTAYVQDVEKTAQEKHSIRSKSEAQILAGAAASAGFYTLKNRYAKGTLPYRIEKLGEKHGWDIGTDINRAYLAPGIEKTANFKGGLFHPLTSMSGGASGIEVSRLRNRDWLIPEHTRALRIMDLQESKANRVLNTRNFVERHQNQGGPLGVYTRWKMGALKKTTDYMPPSQKNRTGGAVGQSLHGLRQVRDTGYFTYTKANTGEEISVLLSPAERMEAAKRLGRIRNIQSQIERKGPVGYGLIERHNLVSRAFDKPGWERNLLIGGAAVGTAAGAGYLYYRHQQKKKPEEERVSFYNKVLPPTFETPKVFPHASVTRKIRFGDEPVSRELGLTGKELPVAFEVGLHTKKVKLRPSDRGYAKNAPLIGDVSFRTTPGGSVAKGAVFHPQNQRNQGDVARRTNIRRGTHEVYIKGRKLPGDFNVGKLQPMTKSGTNPNLMSTEQRENIIWAHAGTDQEAHVKAFYRGAGGDRAQQLLEMWDNPEEVTRIRRRKRQTTREYRQYQRRAVRRLETPYSSTAS